MQGRVAPEVDLVPAQIHKLRSPQAVPEGHEDYRRVTVPVAIALGCRDELVDLGLGQMLPRSQFSVGATARCNCSFYGVRRDQFRLDLLRISKLPRLRLFE
jgi:hypothetical protein